METRVLRDVRRLLEGHMHFSVDAINFTDNERIIEALDLIDSAIKKMDEEFDNE